MQRRKTRTRRPELGAAIAAALCLAGCGSDSEHRVARQPKLPHAAAAALASRSDEVARTLTAGDSCRAASIAQQLQQETIAAINGGQIPGAFQEQLGSTVGDLVSRIRCVPVRNNDDEGRRKDKEKREHKNLGPLRIGGGDNPSSKPQPSQIKAPPRGTTPAAEARNLAAWLRSYTT